jgi:hypothetical protein
VRKYGDYCQTGPNEGRAASPTLALSTSGASGVLAPVLMATATPRTIRHITTSQIILMMLLAAAAPAGVARLLPLIGRISTKNPFNK